MDKKKIEELIRLVEDSEIAELTISGLFRSVRIVKEGLPAATVGAHAPLVTAEPAAPPVDSAEEAAVVLFRQEFGCCYRRNGAVGRESYGHMWIPEHTNCFAVHP